MRQILANRAFIMLWFAGFVLQLAWWMLHTSMLVLVFERTGSSLGTGLIPVVASLPSIFFGAIAGHIVDHLDRQRIMRWGAGILAALMAIALPFANDAPVSLLYMLILLEATVMTVMTPAENALLPTLVDTSLLKTANALNVLNDGMGRILGSAIGALILTHYGAGAMIGGCLSLFVVGWILISAIGQPIPMSRQMDVFNWRESGVISSLRAQYDLAAQIFSKRGVLSIVIGAFALYMVADVPFTAILPVFVVDSLHAGPEGLGLMLSLRGVAGIFGSLLIVAISRMVSARALLVSGLLIYGGSIAIQGVINTFVPGLFFLILVGPAAAAIQTGMNTLLQESSPEDQRGRVFALVGTIGGIVAVIVSLAAGGLGELVNIRVIVVAAGLLQILPALLVIRGISRRAVTLATVAP